MTRLQQVAATVGLLLVVAGIALFSVPAGIIAAGVALLAAGLSDFKG